MFLFVIPEGNLRFFERLRSQSRMPLATMADN